MDNNTTDEIKSDDPLDVLFQRVKNDEWVIDIIEGFDGKSIAINKKETSRRFEETKEEAAIRKGFLETYAELTLDIDDLNDKHPPNSLEWYINIGERITESPLLNERQKKEFYTLMGEVNENFTRDTLRWAERIYELFPKVSATPDLASGDSWFCRLCVKADTAQEVINALNGLEEPPGQRVVAAWDNLDDNAPLDSVVDEILSLVKEEYGFSEEKQVRSVKQVYRMNNRDPPQEEKIRDSFESVNQI